MKKAEKLINDAVFNNQVVEKAKKNLKEAESKLVFSARRFAPSNGYACFSVSAIKNATTKAMENTLTLQTRDLCLLGDDIMKFKVWLDNMLSDSVINTMKEIKEGENNE